MKNVVVVMLMSLMIFSCKTKTATDKFILTGEIKNIPDQKIYLEQLYFSQKDPEILDTTEIKNGKFTLSAIAKEQGLFRLRLDKLEHGFIFINDKPHINFEADAKDVNLEGPDFNTPANRMLKKFMVDLYKRSEKITETANNIDQLKPGTVSDSLRSVEIKKLSDLENGMKDFIINFIDTASNPVVAMFALGYTKNIDPSALKNAIPNLSKRFPKHEGITSLVLQYNQYIAQQNKPKPVNTGALQVGSMAPDFTMNDVNDKPFTLSSLRGKYVLVDFWASWCAPCRAENPFVVAAYTKFKDKNFTILGVSLDDNRNDWIQAIKDDNLSWKQLSDLKGMNNEAANLYGFDGIPYNVLLDPQGKIIATELRGKALDKKLSEIIK